LIAGAELHEWRAILMLTRLATKNANVCCVAAMYTAL
jgi:hypothetical protein